MDAQLNDFPALVVHACDIACAAGELISEFVSAEGNVLYRTKADLSPVTNADEAANGFLVRELANLTRATPVIAEESITLGETLPPSNNTFWLVDPLDGTKEFISRNGEFTVNIALVEDGRPVMGVVYAPALKRAFNGALGLGASCREGDAPAQAISTRPAPQDGLSIVASRSHGQGVEMDAFLAGLNIREEKAAGSSLKFCLVAAGEADVYPRFGRTMEWDTAAGHAVLLAAGGNVTRTDATPLVYGKKGFENPHFIARGNEKTD